MTYAQPWFKNRYRARSPMTIGRSDGISDRKAARTASRSTTIPIQLISPTHATFTMPRGVYFGQANAAVLSHGFPVLWGSLDVGPGAPGVYSANANGAGVARAYWSDSGTPNRPAFTCGAGVALSCLSQPIPASVTVQLQGTGLREADQVEAFVAGREKSASDRFRRLGAQRKHGPSDHLPACLAGRNGPGERLPTLRMGKCRI